MNWSYTLFYEKDLSFLKIFLSLNIGIKYKLVESVINLINNKVKSNLRHTITITQHTESINVNLMRLWEVQKTAAHINKMSVIL